METHHMIRLFLLLFMPLPQPSVVRVDVHYPNHQDHGTGTVIAHNRVITAYHNIRDGGPVTIAGKPATVLKYDAVHDLALLEIPPTDIRPIPLGQKPEVGDQITVCGYPFAGPYWEATGSVVEYVMPAEYEEYTVVVIDVASNPGSSGGAYLNSRGELVAVHWGSVDGESYGSGVEAIQEFLAK